MAKKKKQETTTLMVETGDIMAEIEPEKLKNLINLVKSYSSDMKESTWTFKKKGLLISSTDKKHVCMMITSMSKKFFESWEIKKPEINILLKESTLSDIKTICDNATNAKAETMTLVIEDKNPDMIFRYGNIKRTTKADDYVSKNEMTGEGSPQKIYLGSSTIGKCKIDDLTNFMKAAATWEGDPDRTSRIYKTPKDFRITTEIKAGIDEVYVDLAELLEDKYDQDSLNILILAEKLNNGLKQMKKLTEKITIAGETDSPLIVMKEDQEPEEALNFKKEINWWLFIAPRIEAD